MLLALSGCSRTDFYPPLGATVGGATGSLGGPAGAGGGALLGWSVGKGVALVKENEDLADTVDALSRGDVQALVAAQMKTQMKSQEGKIQAVTGKIHEVTSSVWTALKIAAAIVIGIMAIPLFITRSNTKKINKICEENGQAD